MGCKELILSSILVLTQIRNIGSGGLLINSSSSDNASNMHLMNYRRRSTRSMSAHWKGLVINAENMRLSVMASKRRPIHFAWRPHIFFYTIPT